MSNPEIKWEFKRSPKRKDDLTWEPLYPDIPTADIPPCEACGSDAVFAMEAQEAWVVCCLDCRSQQDWDGPAKDGSGNE